MRRGLSGPLIQRQCDECLAGFGDSVERSAFPTGKWFDTWLKTAQPNSKKRDYAAHLKSPEWRALKLLVFDRDGYRCRKCGDEATDLAHRTYVRFGAELPEDVEASCSSCNQLERMQRVSGFKPDGPEAA